MILSATRCTYLIINSLTVRLTKYQITEMGNISPFPDFNNTLGINESDFTRPVSYFGLSTYRGERPLSGEKRECLKRVQAV